MDEKMMKSFKPEGELLATPENREYLASEKGLERAMASGAVVEGIAILCDSNLRLHVDLQSAIGILEPEEATFCRPGETRKDIAIVSRVGKPVAARIIGLERRNGSLYARLSRRSAQRDCLLSALDELCAGDLLQARVTHLEPFGAFLDIGCGISSLLSVDCISVSRISHPRDRLTCGEMLTVAVKSVDKETQRIYVTLRELLGTWEENASQFEIGQTVTGIIRSVESYGVFIELAPNLAGLAEVRTEMQIAQLRQMIGKPVAVYIKSIVPDRMKIKLVLIDAQGCMPTPKKITYYVDPTVSHVSRWVYSPLGAQKRIETYFDAI